MLKTLAQSPTALYSAAQMRALDAALIASGISGFDLMQRAATAAWAALRQHWPAAEQISVFAGAGNNAGDAYLLAALAQQAGCRVHVWTLADPERLTGDAQQAMQQAKACAVRIEAWRADAELHGVIVDGLLGIGAQGEVRSAYAAAIAAINASGLPVLALDLPSGICADTGALLGCAVRADVSVCFIALKLGLLTGAALDYVGQLYLAELADSSRFAGIAVAQRLTEAHLPRLAARSRNVHKGQLGRVLLIGGERGTGGALLLAGRAALRSGAGLVTLATRPEHVAASLVLCPELMCLGVSSANQLMPHLKQAEVILLGPGLGQGPWSRSVWSAALTGKDTTQVWDADALNLLAVAEVRLPNNLIITPHPGEAARLLGCSVGQVQADRPAAAKALAKKYAATVVLKGAGSLVAGPSGELFLCDRGHPVMAGAGLGDVLTGIIGALLGQGLATEPATRLAVWLHACAGEQLAAAGRGLAASDLLPPVRQLLEEYSPCLN